ncbi:MAG: FliA/WhiG family RNA polymerase sigma factor [Candidatus Omnitrophota bacterium]|nr:FliA/WhiG family RNA polymerase sigma factor [Candidatus Omnitrophota bacterium]
MLKFNKVLDFRIASLIIASVFLLNNIACAIEVPGISRLRKPSDFNGGESVQRYRGVYNGVGEQRDVMIMEGFQQVKYIATRIGRKLPHHAVEMDDLISAGIIGLIDALDKFDPGRGVKFNTYAEWRIRGAMLDSLRGLDWVPRTLRKKSKKINKETARLRAEFDRQPTDEEIARAVGMDVDFLASIKNRINGADIQSLDHGFPDTKSGADTNIDVAADIPSPEDEVSKKELKAILAALIDELPERERLVLDLYYCEELTMKEIGEVLKVNESRICQLHTKAMQRLKKPIIKLGLMNPELNKETKRSVPYANFNEAFQVFQKGRIKWPRTDPEITGNAKIWQGFVSKLAEARKKELKELNTTDFYKGAIAGKSLYGLLGYVKGKYNVSGTAQALSILKERLGISGSSKPEALRQAL